MGKGEVSSTAQRIYYWVHHTGHYDGNTGFSVLYAPSVSRLSVYPKWSLYQSVGAPSVSDRPR